MKHAVRCFNLLFFLAALIYSLFLVLTNAKPERAVLDGTPSGLPSVVRWPHRFSSFVRTVELTLFPHSAHAHYMQQS